MSAYEIGIYHNVFDEYRSFIEAIESRLNEVYNIIFYGNKKTISSPWR